MNIKDILLESPPNSPLFSSYLTSRGLSRQLLGYYENEGWLEKVASGVYKKKGDQLELRAIVKAVQKQLGVEIHLGGPSALAENNVTFNVRFEPKLYLFHPRGVYIKSWLRTLGDLVFIASQLFADHNMSLSNPDELKMSSQERALIESVSMVLKQLSYEEVFHLMEIVPALRAKELQHLLESCTSVVSKRLFFHLAEKVSHPWLNKLDPSKIDFGSGVRQLVKGGQYDSKYQIYVPRMS